MLRGAIRRLIPPILLVAAAAPALCAPQTLSFDEVRAGMRGTGRTVFAGTTVESFEVEILGKLTQVAPGHDLILARCSGGPLARTGVLSGMSGSPVTIDGRLIGAIAYSWGFATEPIAGITPIGEMLALVDRSGSVAAAGAGPWSGAGPLERLQDADRMTAFLGGELRDALLPAAGALPRALPLAVSGLGATGLAHLSSELGGSFQPIQAGAAGAGAVDRLPPLEPGSAIGLQLARGDVELTATGTLTWTDGTNVIAFGHPLLGLGPLELPITAAEVQTLLPSLQQSLRIATPLAEIGALRLDAAAGVAGRLGARPRMIPVRLSLAGAEQAEETLSFELADDPLLSPLLLYSALGGVLAERQRPVGSSTIRLREGSVIKMAEGIDVEIDNLFSGPRAFDYATGFSAYVLYLLLNNAWDEPRIAGINLMLEYAAMPRSARVLRASADRFRVRAGSSLELTVVVGTYRGRERGYKRTVEIPDDTPAGPLTLQVGSASAIQQAEATSPPPLPRDMQQLIGRINRLRRNDRIFVAAAIEDRGLLLEGSRLPNLPPSAAALLSASGQQAGQATLVRRRAILEESIPTDFAIEGRVRVELRVERP